MFRAYVRLRVLLTMALFPLAVVDVSALELRGFRGMHWGDDIERLGEAHRVSGDERAGCYERPHENLLFGDAELRAVQYCFSLGRFSSVRLEANTRVEQLGAEFQSTYGHPDVQGDGGPQWGSAKEGTHARLSADPRDRGRSLLEIWNAPR